MLSLPQAQAMLSLQSKMNSKVDPDWLTARYPYLRAVVVEGAEAIEHHGWKWWKQQACDLPQLQMEMIDIWHFILSELLLNTDGDEARAAERLMQEITLLSGKSTINFDNREYRIKDIELVGKIELLIGLSVARRIEIALFDDLIKDCELGWDELYRQYVSKNVLNFFRQDHGYKEGTYQKIWDSKEDNEHLVEIMQELDAGQSSYQDELYDQLKSRYDRLAK